MNFWVVTAAAAWTVVVLLFGVLIGRALRAADRRESAKQSAKHPDPRADLPLPSGLHHDPAETGTTSEGNGVPAPEAPPPSFAGPPNAGPTA